MSNDPDRLEIGRVAKVHGLRGELSVSLTSNVDDRLAAGAVVETDGGPLTVEHARPHQNRWIVKFSGIDTREAAEQLGRPVLYGTPAADEDALWIHELIGSEVVDVAGIERGVVIEVHDNPASNLLLLSTGALVPLTFVKSSTAGVVTVDVPDGLFDL